MLERAGLAVRAPITVERHAFFNPGESPDQCLTSRAAVLIPLPVVDEVCLVESAVGLDVGCLGRRHQHVNAGLLARRNFLALEIAAISDRSQRLCPDCGASLLCHFRQLIAVAADVGYLVFDDQMVLGIDCGLHVVADDA